MDFFRHCPGCGRRFHIKLVGKKLDQILDRQEVKVPARFGSSPIQMGRYNSAYNFVRPRFAMVEEGATVIVDVEEFQYAYECKHCGHKWTEKGIEKHVEPPGTDPSSA